MSAQKLECPACGQSILPTDDRCLGCGVHLDEGRLVGAATGEAAPLEVTLEPERTPGATPRASSAAVPYQIRPHSQPWDAPGLPGGSGFWASLTRAWAFMGQSIALAGRNSVVIVPSLLSVAIGVVLIGLYILAMALLRGGLHHDHAQGAGHSPVANILAFAVGFGGMLITYWFMGMTADLVSAVLRNQPATLSHAWGECCRNGLALVWLALVTTVVNALTSRARRSGGLLGDLAANAVQTGWRVASYLLVPIVILEDIPLSQAFERAVRLHRDNVVGIIVGEVSVSWLTGALSTIIFVAAAAGAYLLYMAAPLLLPLLIAGCAGVLIIVVAASSYVRIAYYTCLYEWAAAHEAAGEAVPAPAPLAVALNAA